MKRIFLIVLDSCGAGEMPDAAKFGDFGVNTLKSCSTSSKLHIPTMVHCGLGNIEGLSFLGTDPAQTGACARMAEASMGKDTTIGHWEIAGVVSPNPLPTYPNGFPEEVLKPFREATGRGVLANAPWSGTEVIAKYGAEHMRTGDLIVYTSADSVFQIAAHEDIVPLEQLYEYCRIARKILVGKHGVGRVIARPFIGNEKDGFTRTSNRHDFSLEPPAETMLDAIKAAGQDVLAVGKIHDIFAGRGLTDYVYTKGNTDGLAKTMDYFKRDFQGLCFVNLVDFDMLYGHRRNIDGYAAARRRGPRYDHGRPWLRPCLHPHDGPYPRVCAAADGGQAPAPCESRHAQVVCGHCRDRDGAARCPVSDARHELCHRDPVISERGDCHDTGKTAGACA